LGNGPLLRLLIAGDSAAAGVGAATQSLALSGQLVAQLSQHYTVQWTLEAVNGLDTPGLIAHLQNLPQRGYDVVVLSNGVNDVTALRTPSQWLPLQAKLAALINTRFDPGLLIHCALPPMHAFTALPQPLRWFMGRWASEMNRRLTLSLPPAQARRQMHWPFPGEGVVSEGLASDGFHPGPKAYAVWAQSLGQFIIDAQGQWAVRPDSREKGHVPDK